MRPAARPLPPFEIAVGGGSAALTRFQFIRVHRQAHGTPRFAPFKTRRQKNLVQPFLFGLILDQPGTRHHHRQLHVACDMLAAHHIRRYAQILDARIGAGTDEDLVNVNILYSHIGLQAHVCQR